MFSTEACRAFLQVGLVKAGEQCHFPSLTFSNSQAASKLLVFLSLNAKCWPCRAFQGFAGLPLASSKFQFCSGMNMHPCYSPLVVNWLCALSMETGRINLDCQWARRMINICLLLPCSQNKSFCSKQKEVYSPHLKTTYVKFY